ncbi:Hypothetical protein, putative, partial [Bodo saltans]
PEIVSEKLGELKRAAMRFLEPPITVAGTDEQRGRQDAAQLCALIVVKLQEGEALPSSTNEVCDMIVTFVQVQFDRERKDSVVVVSDSVKPPPLQAASTVLTDVSSPVEGKEQTDRTAEVGGGACCSIM